MSKSVSIPIALSELKRASFRRLSSRRERKVLQKETSLPGFIVLVETKGDRCRLYGSTAERNGVHMGDEIVAVNEMTVEGKDHAEVIAFMQQCIRNKLIQLKVRRKNTENTTEGTSSTPEVTEAYLVSVDKEHTKQLTKTLQKDFPSIKVFDMEFIAAGESPEHAQQSQTETAQDSERLRQYEDDLRERKLQKIQKQKENEFLRTSLRASKKLKALSAARQIEIEIDSPAGAAYANAGCDDATTTGGTKNEIEMEEKKEDNNNEAIPLGQVLVSVERIASHLSSMEGSSEDEVRILRQFFDSQPVKMAIEATAQQKRSSQQRVPINVCATTNGVGAKMTREHVDGESAGRSEKENEKLRVVTLYKDEDSYLGATVRNEDSRIVVGRVVKGGIVEKTGLFHEGDELLEMNGVDLRGKKVAEVCDMLRHMSGNVRFVISSSSDVIRQTTPTFIQHYRALFDYEPEDDLYVPCKELAVKFERGDILHVISTDDENWWQAYRDGEDIVHQLAGLIPSSSFRQRVLMYTEEVDNEQKKPKKTGRRTRIPQVMRSFGKKSACEIMRSADEPAAAMHGYDAPCYEEVVLHLSPSHRRRPLVLCGPEGVGCLELRQRLLATDTNRLACPVPYTSRPQKEGEVDGVHYHFVSRQKLSDDAKAGRFIEFGEFQKHLFGTANDDVIEVIKKGKTCVMTLKPESLTSVRTKEVMPFIVFISPPSFLQMKRQKEFEGQLEVKDEQLKAIIQKGKQIEQKFGHLFDDVIVNTDMDKSLNRLKDIVKRLDTEPHWVPAVWLAS